MTPEQKQELDNIAAQAKSLLSISNSVLASEEYIRKSLEVIPPAPPPPPEPTYQLSVTPSVVNEGETTVFTLKVTGLPQGTLVPYHITGVTPDDIDGVFSGNFVLNGNGLATLTIFTKNDLLTEGTEVITLTLDNGLATASVSVLDTSVSPPPAPPPPAPPPPIPPTNLPEIFTRNINPLGQFVFRGYLKNQVSYEREQVAEITADDEYEVQVRYLNRTIGEAPWPYPQISLVMNGKVYMTVPAPKDNVLKFKINCADFNQGEYLMDITHPGGVIGEESCIPWSLFIDRNDPTYIQKTYTIFQETHDASKDKAIWAVVPVDQKPITMPLVKPNIVQFNTPVKRKDLYMSQLVQRGFSGAYYKRSSHAPSGKTNQTGKVGSFEFKHACNQEGYLVGSIFDKIPTRVQLDGERGVGTVDGATHLLIGRNGGVYGLSGSRFWHVSPEGKVKTIAGRRHFGDYAKHNNSLDDTEVVGDWSGMPNDSYKGLIEPWGFTFDPRTLVIDPNSEAIPNGTNGNEQTHLYDPVGYITDSQNNRILRLQFTKNNHDVPVKITVAVDNLNDPWDCVFADDNRLYVSERNADAIIAFDVPAPETGIKELGPRKVVLQGSSACATIVNRVAHRVKSLEECRAQPCVKPEGLFYQDGYLYITSRPTEAVHRLKISDYTWESYYNIPADIINYIGAQYSKLAMSDGTFGPRGTMFLQFWTSNNLNGFPVAVLPDKTLWNYTAVGDGNGPGMTWTNYVYGSSVAVGNGCMVFSSAAYGLFKIYLASGQPTYDWDRYYRPCTDAWNNTGYKMVYGEGGLHGHMSTLPWNKSEVTDKYMIMHNIVKPT